METLLPNERILAPEAVLEMLQNDAPVGIGVSGGKDSSTLAFALSEYLDKIGHPKEKRTLIHSDLGLIEWPESLEWCEKLSNRLETPLKVVRRKAGDMIQRWETRWKNNWNRYLSLQCIKVILPWSTPSMRFCTSELKTDIICRELKALYPTGPILSACGIRAEESSRRAKAAIYKIQPKLQRKSHTGYDWNPILHWKLSEVWELHKILGFPLHPAYTQFGASRVSCSFCILSTCNDQLAALRQPANHEAYKRLCLLELESGFSFQANQWLCDLDPNLREELLPGSKENLSATKALCKAREELEKQLPQSVLFVAGKTWPNQKISLAEAKIIAAVRNSILTLYKRPAQEDPEDIQKNINERVEKNIPEEITALPHLPQNQMELCL